MALYIRQSHDAMTTLAFTAVILSAVLHAAYNLLIKTSTERTLFIWAMYAFAVLLILASSVLAPRDFLIPRRPDTFLYAALSAFFFTLYNLSQARAYAAEGGDLSLSYPLSTTGPLYIPLLAYFFFDERISGQALLGIVVVILAAGGIQIRTSRPPFPGRPARAGLRHRAAGYALLAGFLYSFGAIADKQGVMQSNFYVFTSYVIIIMAGYLTIVVAGSPSLRGRLMSVCRNEAARVAASGCLLYGSFYLYRFALETTSVSYAASVRQISALFGVLAGSVLLGEPYGALRLLAALGMVAGVILIKTG